MDLKQLDDDVFEAIVGAKKPPPGQAPTQYLDAEGFLVQGTPPASIWNGGFAPTLPDILPSASNAPTYGFPAYGGAQGKPSQGGSSDIDPPNAAGPPNPTVPPLPTPAKADESSNTTLFVLLGLGALGLGAWALTRKR